MRTIALLLLLLPLACDQTPGGPEPTSVDPREGSSTQATSVDIIGHSFHIVARTSFDDEATSLNRTFHARLIGAQQTHELGAVTFVSSQRLTAEVPKGLLAGLYTLEVEDPRGQRGTLAGAFTVVGPDDLGVDGGPDGPRDAGLDAPPDQALEMDYPPDTVLPDFPLPDGLTADLPVPDLPLPDLPLLDLPVPDLPLPDVALPDVALPDMPLPDLPVPDLPLPDAGPAGGTVAQILAGDPFGDGTAFSFVFKYDGKVYLGPNKNGTGALRVNPDGTSPASIAFSFPADLNGNKTDNKAAAPYPSIGRAGCAKDTVECGPDNEDGRGAFAAGTLGGVEWLTIAGSKSGGDLEYVYMTSDKDATLDFRFVDLSSRLGGATKGSSAIHVFGDRLYLGFPDTGGSRPYLVVLKTTPPSPGLDVATDAEAENLDAEKMPGIGKSSGMSMIDSIGDLAGLLYVFNNGGCMRSTSATPASYDATPSDWAICTPSSATYTGKTSVTTSKVAEIEPADKAFPQVAAFQGRLYAGRNTTAGPQLWACDPGASPGCAPGEWTLVAPNTTGDLQLCQFNNPNNTHISLVVATAQHLYVGFDNAVDGLVVLRTSKAAAATAADFTGLAGCSGAAHPTSCAGLGGNGFGNASVNRRIFDAAGMTFAAKDYVYLTVGDGTVAVSVYRIFD